MSMEITNNYNNYSASYTSTTKTGESTKESTFRSHGRDTFTKSADVPNSLGVYSAYTRCTSKKISDTILSIMNNDISKVKKSGDVFECGGICFTANQIPKIDCSSLGEVQAENNVLDFGRNKYFKYVSSDGSEHSLYTDNKGIGSIVSEIMRGEPYDAAAERYASFWNYLMTEDPVYIGLNYSDDQIRNYMSEAGVSYGFFTVKMGDREATQFYSATKTTSPIQSKERYDMRYQHLTSGGVLLDEYEPGSVFKIGDKEYVLSENHTLDIPYGEDIYNLQYPSNYRFGEKIDWIFDEQYQSLPSSDTAVISEEGRKALQNKMSAFAKTGTATEVRRLSSVSSFGYCNDYEKILSELSKGSVSDEFVTENYSQDKVDALKSKFKFQDEVKTDSFDCHVNKMVSAYNLMKDAIEDKYANPDRELEYYVADDGSMQQLTKEKELEMLDKAYEKHSIFMATNTEIWADLKDFQPKITYYSNTGQAATSEKQTFQAGYKKNEIKNQAYQAFMSAISGENRNMLLQEQGNLNHFKLDLSISSSARTQINSIWDYYANQKH